MGKLLSIEEHKAKKEEMLIRTLLKDERGEPINPEFIGIEIAELERSVRHEDR